MTSTHDIGNYFDNKIREKEEKRAKQIQASEQEKAALQNHMTAAAKTLQEVIIPALHQAKDRLSGRAHLMIEAFAPRQVGYNAGVAFQLQNPNNALNHGSLYTIEVGLGFQLKRYRDLKNPKSAVPIPEEVAVKDLNDLTSGGLRRLLQFAVDEFVKV
jgi:hypothetical protein